MRIAFDLDDTLIPCEFAFPLEPRPWLASGFGLEPLRQGSVKLFQDIRRRGYQVWVYTTSLRSPLAVHLTFLAHGIVLGGVVNHDRHVRTLGRNWPGAHGCSKYPPAFDIKLLVDNSVGVREEGRRFGFQVLVVDPADDNWAWSVRRAIGL